MNDAKTIGATTSHAMTIGERDLLGIVFSLLTKAASHRLLVASLGVTTWIALLLAAYVAGPRLDYLAYISHWTRVLNGENPWLGDPTNTYGVGHQILAFVFAIHPLAPKMLFVLSWFGTFLIIFEAVRRNTVIGLATFALVYGTPFYVILVSGYGMGDALVGFLTLLAVDLRIRRQMCIVPGVVLALAVLTKIYPLAILPFLATERGRIDWRFIVAVVATVVFGISCTVAIWGWSLLNILETAVVREGKPLSIFWFLYESHYSPVARTSLANALLEWNVLVLLAVMVSLYAAHFLGKLRAITGCVLASIALLAFYKVGLPQYFIQSVTLLIYFLATEWADQRLHSRGLLLAVIGYLGFLNIFELWYLATSGSHIYPQVRAFVGLPCFITGIFLIRHMMLHEREVVAAFGSSYGRLSGAR